MSCRHVRDWLHREASSLDEAQRLQLDDHLASCEACRGDRARMQLVQRAGRSLDAPAESRMYDRAIARALLERGASNAARETPRRAREHGRWLWPLAIGVAAAAAIGAWIVVREDGSAHREAERESKTHDGVARESKTHDEAPGDAADRDLSSPDLDDLASASVAVRVERAAVATAAATTAIAHSVRVQVVIAASSIPVAVTLERDEVTPAPPSRTALEPVADVLARARGELAAKHYADAERTASSVLPRATGPDEAEARTILADIARAAGNLDLASTLYREVATKFASLSAGESALFSAARLEIRRGGDARALLEQYLDRYPRGRFVDDARRLLGASTKEQR